MPEDWSQILEAIEGHSERLSSILASTRVEVFEHRQDFTWAALSAPKGSLEYRQLSEKGCMDSISDYLTQVFSTPIVLVLVSRDE